jgi:hypothetical protein
MIAASLPRIKYRLAACIGVSMLLHILVLSVYRSTSISGLWSYEDATQHRLTATLQPQRTAPDGELGRDESSIATQRVSRMHRSGEADESFAARRGRDSLHETPGIPAPESALNGKHADGKSATPGPDALPVIDLDAARRVARESAKSRSGIYTQGHPWLANAAPEMETPIARAIAGAERPDCRRAYAGLGLFAIPALLLDTLRDAGCKW